MSEPKLVARPWQPQDLLDDLQLMIDGEPNYYGNANRDTLCMAKAYLEEHFAEPKWISVETDREKVRSGGPMQVEKVLPCVCADHEPDGGDSVFYGMPQLKVAGYNGKPLFTPYCPNCGRGGLEQYKSAYLALKAWNELMRDLRWLEDGTFE